MWTELLVILALVLVNGLLSGAEIALVSLRKSRVEQWVADGRHGAAAVQALRAQPERFLATVQIGITVVGAGAGAYGGDALTEDVAPWLTPMLGSHAHEVAFVVVVAGISYLSLVLGELVPKSLALRESEAYALLAGPVLLGIARLARPVVWLLTASSNLVLRLFGDRTSFTESRATADELRAMLEEAGLHGAVHPRVGDIASRAVALGELRASDVMVPRSEIAAVSADATLDELRDVVAASRHTRILVYGRDIDDIVGVVSAREAFARSGGVTSVSELRAQVPIVPESMRAVDVLRSLQGQGAELAVVVDEHGGTAGLVSREDLAEELFGEFDDVQATAPPDPSQLAAGVVLAATTLVRDANRALSIGLPEAPGYSTLAGLVMHLAGRIPVAGEAFPLRGDLVVEIVDASPRRVRTVRVRAGR